MVWLTSALVVVVIVFVAALLLDVRTAPVLNQAGLVAAVLIGPVVAFVRAVIAGNGGRPFEVLVISIYVMWLTRIVHDLLPGQRRGVVKVPVPLGKLGLSMA